MGNKLIKLFDMANLGLLNITDNVSVTTETVNGSMTLTTHLFIYNPSRGNTSFNSTIDFSKNSVTIKLDKFRTNQKDKLNGRGDHEFIRPEVLKSYTVPFEQLDVLYTKIRSEVITIIRNDLQEPKFDDLLKKFTGSSVHDFIGLLMQHTNRHNGISLRIKGLIPPPKRLITRDKLKNHLSVTIIAKSNTKTEHNSMYYLLDNNNNIGHLVTKLSLKQTQEKYKKIPVDTLTNLGNFSAINLVNDSLIR